MIRRLLLAACLATPAQAELPLPAAETLAPCWISGLTRENRLSMLAEGGFVPVSPDDALAAAAAIAPWRLLFLDNHGMFDFADDPALNSQRLRAAIKDEAQRIANPTENTSWFRATGEGGDAYLFVQWVPDLGYGYGRWRCTVTLPPGDWREAMNFYTGMPFVTTGDVPALRLTRFPVDDNPDHDFWLGEYRPVAFGGTETWPILRFPATDLPD